MCGLMRAIYVVTKPLATLLSFSTNIVSKLFGVSEQDEGTVTEEEIRMMVDVGQEKGVIEDEEKLLIENVFEFNDKLVSEIMIHRKDIYAVDISLNISDVLSDLQEYVYSRIPVYEETVDNIVRNDIYKRLIKIL